jgi:hypothetical protein
MTVDFMLFKVVGCDRIAAVPFIESSTVVILLASILGVVVMILSVFWGAARTLARIERRLAELQSRDGVGEERLSAAENAAGGAFETFLSEDPARRQLPKKEQFAAYRKWRQEKGLNWSNSQ